MRSSFNKKISRLESEMFFEDIFKMCDSKELYAPRGDAMANFGLGYCKRLDVCIGCKIMECGEFLH